MHEYINALLVTPTNTITFKKIKNSKSEFETLLGGDIKERLYHYPTIGNIKRISVVNSSSCILINVNAHDEACNMNISEAYEILHALEFNVRLQDEVSVQATDYVPGKMGSSLKQTTDIQLGEDNKIHRVAFSFFQEENDNNKFELNKIGSANIHVFDTESLSCGIIDAAAACSPELLASFSEIEVYEDKEEASSNGGVSGKIAVISSLFIDGPFSNKDGLELSAIQEVINYFSNIHKVDFLIMNPALFELFIFDEIKKYVDDEEVLFDFKNILINNYDFNDENPEYASAILDMGFRYLKENLNAVVEEYSSEEASEFATLHFTREFLTEILEMSGLTVAAKGLLMYFILYRSWKVEELLEFVYDDEDDLEAIFEELEEEELIYNNGDEYCIREEFIEYLGVKFLTKTFEPDSDLDEVLTDDLTGEQTNPANGLRGIDFEVFTDKSKTGYITMDDAYLDSETYTDELRPYITRNLLMTRKKPLTMKFPYQNTALMLTVFHGDKDMVRSILENFSTEEIAEEIVSKNAFGQNALSLAIRKNFGDLVTLLLEVGFSISGTVTLEEASNHENLFLLALLHNAHDSFDSLFHYAQKHTIDIREELKSVLELDAQKTKLIPNDIINICYEGLSKETNESSSKQ